MTQLIVLGFLSMKPMSGYDIQQLLQMTDAKRWAGILVGSIYHALKTLEKDKYIEISSLEQTGMRQKAIYTITEEGRRHLKSLICDSLTELSVVYPSNFYSGLSLYDSIPKEECRKLLQTQCEYLEKECGEVQSGAKLKNEAMHNDVSPMTELIMENMIETIKLQKEFVQKALQILD